MIAENELWVRFACAALRAGPDWPGDTIRAGEAADRMLVQYDKRYGNAAYILEGITECEKCKCELPKDASFVASDGSDGVYKKFCMDCYAEAVLAVEKTEEKK